MSCQSQPYGLWASPISAAMLSQRISLQDVQWDSDGQTLLWLEGRGDRNVLVARPDGDACRDLTQEENVRGTVGYGGGDFCVSAGVVYFAAKDGRLYRRGLGAERARPITPAFGGAASPAPSPCGKWVAYVFSDGSTDLLGLVDAQGQDWPRKLARGADFYMQPAWHPQGSFLAWVEWDHPNMPWDGSRLMLGRIAGECPNLEETTCLAGGVSIPASQPGFSPDGRFLAYIETEGNWEKLMLFNLQSGERFALAQEEGLLLAPAAWVQGVRSYAWSADSRFIYHMRYVNGAASLWKLDVQGGGVEKVNTAPYTWLSRLSLSPLGQPALVASAPGIPDRVVRWDGTRWVVEARSEGENVAPEYFSLPQPVSWKAADGMAVYGLFYPPSNPNFVAEGMPPAILNIHGGPTNQSVVRYSAETGYFTSRGYAVLEVNYRGSCGYGRAYQDALRERWGLVDTEDAIGAAQALADQRLADGKRLVIKGGSAGGYTVLNALVHAPGTFRAGVCLYGVSNLFTLAADTHKFEAHYTDSLVGPLPQAAERYHAWSPIFHADAIRDPLAVFQGSIDKAVPPQQSESMVRILQQRGIPYIYRLYEGEGHGFRKPESILDYLQQTERFLQQYVLFTA
jgi:dipeptidyl aminopeptidase/acylaminoacyl peptidase